MPKLSLHINGELREIDADPAMPLIFALRNAFGLTGAKLGCGLEQCGACAVLAGGEEVLSCVRAVSEFDGADIITPEGLGADPTGARIQRAFTTEGAAQCGYCTPGIAVAATALLKRDPAPDTAAVAEALNGHLCRCGSHARVLAAIRRAIADGGRHGG